jgi:hypothetical protein
MQANLEGLKECNVMKDTFIAINLIEESKGLTYKFEGQQYHATALHQAKKRFYVLYQGKEATNVQFLEKFQTSEYVVEQLGGNIRRFIGAVKAELVAVGVVNAATATDEHKLEATKSAKNKYMDVAWHSGPRRTRSYT